MSQERAVPKDLLPKKCQESDGIKEDPMETYQDTAVAKDLTPNISQKISVLEKYFPKAYQEVVPPKTLLAQICHKTDDPEEYHTETYQENAMPVVQDPGTHGETATAVICPPKLKKITKAEEPEKPAAILNLSQEKKAEIDYYRFQQLPQP
ncbi:hemogen-like [Vombatus ursinus]|uniref:hemogen-like n=1 Tax=Vombatus ursinus TaxID=29139 RepID=UPI000FFD54A3|nr:hemogen-like [Vombatus ursinus]